MRKNYETPMTKVVSININAIMEPEMVATSTEVEQEGTATEAPLF